METLVIIELILGGIFILCAFSSIGLAFYIGRHHIKQVDRAALGYEINNDSIFYLMLRIPNYTMAFMWALYAERGGIARIREQFDKKFQLPFVIYFWLIVVSACAFAVALIVQRYFLQDL